MRKWLILLLLVPSGSARIAAALETPNTPALTIGGAFTRALDANPAVREAREKLSESDAATRLAFAQVFPTLSLAGSANYRKDPFNIGNPLFGGEPYNLYDVSFHGAQPLFDGGALWAGINVARRDREIRAAEVELAERDLGLNVIQSYYTLLLNQRKVENLRREEEVQKEILGFTQQRQRIGRAQLLDVLQIRTQLALISPKLAQAENQVRISAAELAILLGDRELREIHINGSLTPVDPARIDPLLAREKSRQPELEKVRLQRDQLDSRRTVNLAKHWPQLSANAVWGRNAYVKTDLLNTYSTYWALGLQLSIPLFSGLSSFQERSLLAAQSAELEIEEAGVINKAALEEVRARKNLETARSTIESSKAAFELARQSLEEGRRSYRVSTIDFQHFLTIQQNFIEAESSLDQSRYDSVLALARYFTAAGLPLRELVAAIEPKGVMSHE